jgi:malate dehydrogenase (oxaloacetate-decarboxylating)(NADP+)
VVIDEGLAKLILVGRPGVIERRLERNGLRIRPGKDFELVNPESDPRYREYWTEYHRLAERRGVTQQFAQTEMRQRHTLIGAMMMHRGEADGLVCGAVGTYGDHLQDVDRVIGRRPGVRNYYAMNALMLPRRTVFICDTYVNLDPTAEQLAEMTTLAAREVRRFGVVPRVALLSHSNFGNSDASSARKMREALELIRSIDPELAIDGEMHGDSALNAELRLANFPRSRLKEDANLLIMPTLDAANIAFNLLKTAAGDGITIGPILLGSARPVHILTTSATVRRIVNVTALTVVDVNASAEETRSKA